MAKVQNESMGFFNTELDTYLTSRPGDAGSFLEMMTAPLADLSILSHEKAGLERREQATSSDVRPSPTRDFAAEGQDTLKEEDAAVGDDGDDLEILEVDEALK